MHMYRTEYILPTCTYVIVWDLGHDESWIRDMGEVTDTEQLQPRVARQPPRPGDLEHQIWLERGVLCVSFRVGTFLNKVSELYICLKYYGKLSLKDPL